jgi:hypothetical protein
LKAAHTTVTARFTLPDAGDAFGVSFVTAKTSTTSATSGSAVVFQQGRVVAISYLQSSSGGLNRADAAAIARAEHSLLEQSEPTFSLARTTRPLGLSLLYGLVTIVVASLVVILPGLRRRRRASRQARREEQARREYRARGGKAMRRHRPPTWAQRARSSGSIRSSGTTDPMRQPIRTRRH